MNTPIISNENKPTINIKITDLKSGKEIFNKNANSIIGGLSDNNGKYAGIVTINGNRVSILSTLCANKDAVKHIEKFYPLEALICEKMGEEESSKGSQKIPDSAFDKLIKELLVDD
jgi:hypothetical protein